MARCPLTDQIGDLSRKMLMILFIVLTFSSDGCRDPPPNLTKKSRIKRFIVTKTHKKQHETLCLFKKCFSHLLHSNTLNNTAN
jgi:hypothetical protein